MEGIANIKNSRNQQQGDRHVGQLDRVLLPFGDQRCDGEGHHRQQQQAHGSAREKPPPIRVLQQPDRCDQDDAHQQPAHPAQSLPQGGQAQQPGMGLGRAPQRQQEPRQNGKTDQDEHEKSRTELRREIPRARYPIPRQGCRTPGRLSTRSRLRLLKGATVSGTKVPGASVSRLILEQSHE